jgi:GTPase Era involved in 16S rRNA processing
MSIIRFFKPTLSVSINNLLGNKVDKSDEREIPERIGQSFADANVFDYFLETSALDATNVDTLFHEVATRLTNDMKHGDDGCEIDLENFLNLNLYKIYLNLFKFT